MRLFFLRRAHEPQNCSVEEVSWKFWLFTHPYLYCMKIFYISAENTSVSLDKARKLHYYSVEKGSGQSLWASSKTFCSLKKFKKIFLCIKTYTHTSGIFTSCGCRDISMFILFKLPRCSLFLSESKNNSQDVSHIHIKDFWHFAKIRTIIKTCTCLKVWLDLSSKARHQGSQQLLSPGSTMVIVPFHVTTPEFVVSFSACSSTITLGFAVVQLLSHVWLCDPMYYSPPGSSLHEISWARIMERVAISSSGGSSHPGIKPTSPAWQVDSLPLSHLGSQRSWTVGRCIVTAARVMVMIPSFIIQHPLLSAEHQLSCWQHVHFLALADHTPWHFWASGTHCWVRVLRGWLGTFGTRSGNQCTGPWLIPITLKWSHLTSAEGVGSDEGTCPFKSGQDTKD